MLVQHTISTTMISIKKLDIPENTWTYKRNFEIPLCSKCRSKRGIHWTFRGQIINISGINCRCIEDKISVILSDVRRDIHNVGVLSGYQLGYSKGLALLEVDVIILFHDADSCRIFKLKNLDKYYRKVNYDHRC